MTDDHLSRSLTENKKALRASFLLTFLFMLVEVAGGIVSGSLALLADAGHMFTDAAALGLGFFAFWLSSRPRTAARTFGWHRFEIFAALLNGVALWGVSGIIVYEAVRRLKSPPVIKGGLMMAVALVGLSINIAVAAILFKGRRRNLNVRGAFLHVLGDGLGSVGVVAAALFIRLTGSYIWDPIISAGVCILILWTSGRLIRESFHIFMEGAPPHLDVSLVERALSGIDGVVEVHDLHVWTIASGFVSLSAHLKVRKDQDAKAVLHQAHEVVAARFKIEHTTFQMEIDDASGCETGSCPAEAERPPKPPRLRGPGIRPRGGKKSA